MATSSWNLVVCLLEKFFKQRVKSFFGLKSLMFQRLNLMQDAQTNYSNL